MFVFLTALQANEDLSRLLNFDLSFLNEMWVVWVNLALIIALLSWLLYKPMLGFLEKRREGIKNDIESAAENFRKSEEARKSYDEKLSGIKAERDEILNDAKKTATARQDEIIGAAKSEADRIIDRAKRDIEQERQKAKDEMHKHIVQISTIMAEKLMGDKLNTDEKTRSRLLNQAIADLGDAKWKN